MFPYTLRRLRLLVSYALVFTLAFGAESAFAQSKKKRKPTGSASSSATARPKADVPEPFPAAPAGRPTIRAGSAILVDANTGKVLYELNADQPRPVASTQKVMTALLVAEQGDMEGDVKVQAVDTYAEPSKLYIKPGEVYRRGDLLRVLLVKSMNDVARCLARDNAGSIESFAVKMNAKAQQLGMGSSYFINPNGLPAPGQHSTARDMARLALAAYRNRTIRNIVATKELRWTYPDGRVTTFKNTNRVLRNYPLCNGMKTGYTEASGFCLISSGANGGREVISVVLGDAKESIWIDSYKLLSWGLNGSPMAQN